MERKGGAERLEWGQRELEREIRGNRGEDGADPFGLEKPQVPRDCIDGQ